MIFQQGIMIGVLSIDQFSALGFQRRNNIKLWNGVDFTCCKKCWRV